jgi:uncharacterized protein
MKWKRNNKVIEESLVDYLEKLFIERLEQKYTLKVSVGTDSQKISRFSYKFATVILITMTENLGDGIIVGRGGMIVSSTYFHEFKQNEKKSAITHRLTKSEATKMNKDLVNERMVFEVGQSIDVAREIALLLDVYDIPLEIHADINPDPKHDSNKALQSAVGYILGMGYEFKIKPEAWAASTAADKKC